MRSYRHTESVLPFFFFYNFTQPFCLIQFFFRFQLVQISRFPFEVQVERHETNLHIPMYIGY